MFTGNGLVVAEGETHQRQRRIMNPAFGAIPVREMTSIFVDVSRELCDEMRTLCSGTVVPKSGLAEEEKKGDDWTVIDMAEWTSRAALDMLSLAAFQYPLNTLQGARSTNDQGLFHALEQVYTYAMLGFLYTFFRAWIPLLRLRIIWGWDDASTRINHLNVVARKLAKKLIQERTEMIKDGHVDAEDKDILTLLIKAMLDGQQTRTMSEDEVVGQIFTMIVSGTPHPFAIWFRFVV